MKVHKYHESALLNAPQTGKIEERALSGAFLPPYLTSALGVKCWIKQPHTCRQLFFFCFVHSSISVIAGPDYFEGAYKQAMLCYAWASGNLMKNTNPKHEIFTNSSHIKTHDSSWCISRCSGLLEIRIRQNFSGCSWPPHPHPAQ